MSSLKSFGGVFCKTRTEEKDWRRLMKRLKVREAIEMSSRHVRKKQDEDHESFLFMIRNANPFLLLQTHLQSRRVPEKSCIRDKWRRRRKTLSDSRGKKVSRLGIKEKKAKSLSFSYKIQKSDSVIIRILFLMIVMLLFSPHIPSLFSISSSATKRGSLSYGSVSMMSLMSFSPLRGERVKSCVI